MEHTGADSVMSTAISKPMLHIQAESSSAHSSMYRSDIRVLDLLPREYRRMPSRINPQNLLNLCELQVMVSEDLDEKDLEFSGVQ